MQKLTFGATAGTIINAGTASFTLTLPIGATPQFLRTDPIQYTNDPIELATRIQTALNDLFSVVPTNGALIVSEGTGLGMANVTPLTPV